MKEVLNMQKLVGLILLLLLCSTSLFGNQAKKVLLLNSYHQGMTWVDNITKAVEETLEPKKNNIILYVENMDTKRNHSKEYYNSLKDLYKSKYKDIEFDLILGSDNNAFNFLLENRDEVFGEVPISFSGVNHFKDELLEDIKNISGVAEKFSAKETIELMLRNHPNVKNIYVINDYLTTGRAWESNLKEVFKAYESKVNVIYSDNLTIEDLKRKVDSFSEETLILFGVYFADKNRDFITYEKIGKYLLSDSNAPVYCLLKFNISDEVIGGKVISGYFQGREMSKIGLRILRGENADDIPVLKEGANSYIFNYNALEKFGVDESKLPKESIILERPSSLFLEYRNILVTLITVICVIVGIVFIFIYYIKYINRNKGYVSERSIIFLIRFLPIIVIPLVTIFMIFMLVDNTNEKYNRSNNEIFNALFAKEKASLQKDILWIKKMIRSKNSNSEGKKEEIIKFVKEFPTGNERYIFIFDYQGNIFFHPDKRLLGKNFYELNIKSDSNLEKKVKTIVEKRGSDFLEYRWLNPLSNQEESKISFMSSVPEFQWVLGSGIYPQDIKSMLMGEKSSAKESLSEKNIQIVVVLSIVLIVISIVLSNFLSKVIETFFIKYREKIDEEIQKNKKKDKILFEQGKKVAMGEMISVIAHQLKQPLNALNLLVYNLVDSFEFDELDEAEVKRFSNKSLEKISFMAKTIDDFRNFFKPGKKALEFSVKASIEKMTSLFSIQLINNSITLSISGEDIKVVNYANEFEQVILNIVANAKDVLIERDVKERKINIELFEENGYAVIKIYDNGGGIDNKIIQKVFDPYFSTKGDKGTGIGLNLSKMIIEESMKGKITVYNDSEGAVFEMKIQNIL